MAEETGNAVSLDLEAIKARCAAATEGPWYRSPNDAVISWTARPASRGPVMVAGRGVADDGESELVVIPDGCDAEFIAHARTDIPALIDVVEADGWRGHVVRGFFHALKWVTGV